MHRIQNVVVPPRSSELHQLHRGRNNDHQHGDSNISYGHYMLRRIYSRILPLNLSRTSTRLAAHLPSLYVLLRMLLLWTLVLLQTADVLNLPHNGEIKQSSSYITGWQTIFDFNSWLWVQKLVLWSSAMEMETICWRTFCSVCAAFCVEALVKGLDGAGVGLTAHMNANTSPFNLVRICFELQCVGILTLIPSRIGWLRLFASHLFFADYPHEQVRWSTFTAGQTCRRYHCHTTLAGELLDIQIT